MKRIKTLTINTLCLLAWLLLAQNYAYAIHEDNITFILDRTVYPNALKGQYYYAPSFMFDETDGKFKVWGCWGDGDEVIGYKEAYNLKDLYSASMTRAFEKSGVAGTFDNSVVCDPSVIRDSRAGFEDDYYLYYGAHDLNGANPGETKIGVAKSTDGGKTFTRLPNSTSIVKTGDAYTSPAYGTGQPAVVYNTVDSYYYMIYTYQPKVTPNSENKLKVIKSLSPDFSDPHDVTTINSPDIGSWSVDLAWNPSRSEFMVIVNSDGYKLKIVHYDSSFTTRRGMTEFERPCSCFQFGEGIAVLTNSKGDLSKLMSNGLHSLVFVGATHEEMPPCGAPCHIMGDTKFVIFSEGNEGVWDNYTPDGWDVGLYNPSNLGKFHIYYGASDGIFSDQTDWSWGVFPGAQVFTGDFNGDEKWDVGLYNPNNQGNFYIQYGDGTGTFSSETAWHWGVFPGAQVFTGDFDGDGKWDVGLYNPNNQGNFYIHYGNGTGTFSSQTAWHWGVFPGAQVFTGDFDGNGKWDVGLYNPNNQGNFYIQYGDGTGAFASQTAWHWGVFSNAQVFTGDFDGNGKWDVGLYNPNSNGDLFVKLGDGGGAFHNQRIFHWATSGKVFTGKFK